MQRFKKELSLCCTLAMLIAVFSFAPVEASEPETEIETAEETEVLEETETSEETEISEETEALEDIETFDDFEEQVLADNDECIVKVTGIEADSSSFTIKFYFENKAETTDYALAVKNSAVNGLAIYSTLHETVKPGGKEDFELTIPYLSEYGIEKATDVSFDVRVYDDDGETNGDIVSDTFHVYPYGEENAERYERASQESDIILANTADASVTVIGTEAEKSGRLRIELYLENKSDATAMFASDDVLLDGTECGFYWIESIESGDSTFTELVIPANMMKENDIDAEDVSEVKMTIRVYDGNDADAEDFINETVVISL